jgi:hypothetical protein
VDRLNLRGDCSLAGFALVDQPHALTAQRDDLLAGHFHDDLCRSYHPDKKTIIAFAALKVIDDDGQVTMLTFHFTLPAPLMSGIARTRRG